MSYGLILEAHHIVKEVKSSHTLSSLHSVRRVAILHLIVLLLLLLLHLIRIVLLQLLLRHLLHLLCINHGVLLRVLGLLHLAWTGHDSWLLRHAESKCLRWQLLVLGMLVFLALLDRGVQAREAAEEALEEPEDGLDGG